MRIILVYDIALEEPKDQNRLNKVRKTVKKYIHHIQKSVFEGDITEAKLEKLKAELRDIIDSKRDMVLIYVFDGPVEYKRLSLTEVEPEDGNIL